MEYEPEYLVPVIDDHMFSNEDGADDDGADDEEQEMTMEIGGVMTRPCLMDLVKVDWNKLKEMNVNKLGWLRINKHNVREQLQNTSWIESRQ